jgi:catechol 2,3-dioxygenase-like lactoylglutathione lyase family enzyme
MFKKVSYIVLFTGDLPRLLAFYRDKLGLPVRRHVEGYVDFDLEAPRLAIYDYRKMAARLGEAPIPPRPIGHRFEISFYCENVDATYETLLARGVEFRKPPTDMDWGQRVAWFEDPDGNLLEIFTPLRREQ